MPISAVAGLARRTIGRSLAAARLLALLAVASWLVLAGPDSSSKPGAGWLSRTSLGQILRDAPPIRRQVLHGYDTAGLAGAMEAFQALRRESAAAPYYRTVPESVPLAQLRERADAVMADGFTYGGRPRFPLETPVDWSADPYRDRSWRFWLNGLEPLDDVLSLYARTGEARYLRFAVRLARDWLRQNPVSGGSNPFAWYDMAVGLRALKLAYLTDAAARDPQTEPDALAELLAGCWTHGWQLAQERNFNARTNHGIYQAAGLLALGQSSPELADAERWRALGTDRLRAMFAKCFSREGVHLEHSPGYHLSMTRLLVAMLESGLTADPALASLRGKAENALAWLVAPDGSLPMLGDSDSTRVRPGHLGFPDERIAPELAYVLTRGTDGSPPSGTYRVFPEAGFAVFRDGWPSARQNWQDSGYLIFAAGFHSRTHKHADDLTFEWWDGGRAIIVDSGRYGYYYDDPWRIYCESTRAHNTVEIDRRDLSRDRRDAFGSALTSWGAGEGAYFVSAEIDRSPGPRHRRTLVWRPGKWLVVLDELDADRVHDYRQWFHFHPDLSLTLHDASADLSLGDGRSLYLRPLLPSEAATATAVHGQEEPETQGWISRRHRTVEPNWALSYSASGERVTLATLLFLGGSEPTVQTGQRAARVETGRVEFTWRRDGATEGFVLRRGGQSATIETVGE